MKEVHTIHSLKNGSTNSNYVEHPNSCPLCKSAINASVLYSVNKGNSTTIYTFNFCPACEQLFIGTHNPNGDFLTGEPNRFKEKVFSEQISKLSPQFVKIYNQALAAESSKLDEIAGIGYRKALEFLIKDFCIHENHENEEEIKNMLLSKCINTYIEQPKIKELALKSAWLGNDETHYVRKFTDRDIADLKGFIEAMVYFISMILKVYDAMTITP